MKPTEGNPNGPGGPQDPGGPLPNYRCPYPGGWKWPTDWSKDPHDGGGENG